MRATILSVLLLCSTTFILGVTADAKCDVSGEVGDRVPIDLGYPYTKAEDELVWKRSTVTIIKQKKGKLVTGKEGDVEDNGSLVLHNVTMEQKGEYSAEVFNSGGKQVYSVTKNLCVREKVSKPGKPSFTCSDFSVKLTCSAQGTSSDIVWLKNNKETKKTGTALILKLTEITAADEFSCSISNKIRSAQSDAVKVSCPGLTPERKLFGLDMYIMIAILAGGGGLFLILVGVLVFCCFRRYRQNKNRFRDEEELRLAAVTQQQQQQQKRQEQRHQEQDPYAHPHGQHRHQAPPRGHAPPCPHPQNGDGQTPAPPRSRGKPRSRPPPVPAEDGAEEQPPPRPRPRQSAPRHNR
ncbi:T-cell surface antigen CD2-like [Scleropages formosus]|uniref:T-cell surface antigen CD2-like n=1 Tax=Scleropages formosus TaxID=113540 RepID=UPI0010FA737D|nr:T-cell surface antigen CD2-like [Scleropages formosus]